MYRQAKQDMRTLTGQRGLTLIELMATLVVVAILATVGVPSFQNLMKDNRRTTQINELVSAMNLARSEATKGNGAVAFCPSTDGATCGGGTFDAGWIVFINLDGDSPPAVDGGERILRTHSGTTGSGTSLRATGGFTTGMNFLASGRPDTFGDITYCDDRGAGQARNVMLNLVGVVRSGYQHSDSSALTCP